MTKPLIFSLQTPQRVLAGVGCISGLHGSVEEFKASRVLIVTDKGICNAGLIGKPRTALLSEGIDVEIINSVPPEPEISQVREIFESVKGLEFGALVGIGGGSVMDVTKLIAAMTSNRDFVHDMTNAGLITERRIPTIMVPTTAGTGSEATPNAIVTVPEQQLKVGIVSKNMIPDCVFLDPEMTLCMPPAITASTGMDAFTHALECYISNKANPFSDLFALKAMRMIYGSIRTAYRSGADLNARLDMLLGAFYGGVCIASSGTAAVHALAYPLGGKYRIPHGVSNAMLLPFVMEFNLEAVKDKFACIWDEIGIDKTSASEEEKAEKFVESIFLLNRDLDIPTDIKRYGISKNDLDSLVESACGVSRLLDNNPRELSKADMRAIYERLL